MTYDLTEARKKLLTEKVMGECWHEFGGWSGKVGSLVHSICNKCFQWFGSNDNVNRTFTTPQDMWDLQMKLINSGEWNDFYVFAQKHWRKAIKAEWYYFNMSGLWAWFLSDIPRFCCLVAMWKEEKG